LTNSQIIVGLLFVLLAIVVARFVAYALWSRFTRMGRFESRIYDQVEDSLRMAERAGMYDRVEQSLREGKRVLSSDRRRASK
jgi:hypothetical protein